MESSTALVRQCGGALSVQQRDSLTELAQKWKSGAYGDQYTDGVPPPGATRPYKDIVWCYACIRAIATNVAQVPLNFTQNETELPEPHDLHTLFKKPNPLMSGYDLFVATETSLNLTGNSLWIPVPRNDGKGIAEIWQFDGNQFSPKVTRKGEFLGWEVTWWDQKFNFTPEEALHYRYWNPYDPIMGMGPVSAIRSSIDQDWWANKYNETFFKNFAEPGMVISFPGTPSEDIKKASRESWNERHQVDPERYSVV